MPSLAPSIDLFFVSFVVTLAIFRPLTTDNFGRRILGKGHLLALRSSALLDGLEWEVHIGLWSWLDLSWRVLNLALHQHHERRTVPR